MSEKPEKAYSLSSEHAKDLLKNADEQIEIISDLLEKKIVEDPIDLRVISYLCDSFSCNYHIRRILKTNLNFNSVKEAGEERVALHEADLIILENAILSSYFTKKELLKLNYSLALH